MVGPLQGFELTSRVSRDELYFWLSVSHGSHLVLSGLSLTNASARAVRPGGSILLSLRFNTLSVRLRFSTWAMYVTPFYLVSTRLSVFGFRYPEQLTLISFPLRSSVNNRPIRSTPSNALTLL